MNGGDFSLCRLVFVGLSAFRVNDGGFRNRGLRFLKIFEIRVGMFGVIDGALN